MCFSEKTFDYNFVIYHSETRMKILHGNLFYITDSFFALNKSKKEYSVEEWSSKREIRERNWKEQNEQLLSGLTGQSVSSYMIQVFVLLAVLLGIASVLAISVVQKSKQLGILKAMGIKDRTASLIFLFQGFMLGVIGSLLGIGLGIGLSYAFSVFVKNPDGTALVPFFLDIQFIVISFVIAVIATTVAAFIPAKNSSKLNPIEVIKNG